MYREEWEQEKVDRHLLAARLTKYGISYLDDALSGILPNDLIVIGARTGRGKTELATTIAFNAASQGKDVVFFALEADKWEIQRRMKYRKLAQYFFAHYAKSTDMKFPTMRDWLTQGFSQEWDALENAAEEELSVTTTGLHVVYKGEKYTASDFVRDLEGLREADLVIVDHLHYFDIDEKNETDGLKKAVHAIRNAAIFHAKPVILLAHLRKGDRTAKAMPELDDFHGHSDIVKVATTVLLLSPAPTEGHERVGHWPTYFHIAKCRTAGEVTAYVGLLGFDVKSNCYAERYYLETASGFETGPQPVEEFPAWAKRAVRAIRTYGGES